MLGVVAFGFLIAAAAKSAQFAIPYLAARCDGSADSDQRLDPCRYDGQCRRLPAGAFLPGFEGVPGWRDRSDRW